MKYEKNAEVLLQQYFDTWILTVTGTDFPSLQGYMCDWLLFWNLR